jgi:hypothetical protein
MLFLTQIQAIVKAYTAIYQNKKVVCSKNNKRLFLYPDQ